MTTIKPLADSKSKTPVYYDELVQLYNLEESKMKGTHNPVDALAELKKHLSDKKSAKARLVAGETAMEFKKKGAVGKAPKLKSVPYTAVKAFYQFTDSPAFLVLGLQGIGIPKQYLVMGTPSVDKARKLSEILQVAQWAPGNNLKNEVPPVNPANLSLAKEVSETSDSRTPDSLRRTPLESRSVSRDSTRVMSSQKQVQRPLSRTMSISKDLSSTSIGKSPPPPASRRQKSRSPARALSSTSSSTSTRKRQPSPVRTTTKTSRKSLSLSSSSSSSSSPYSVSRRRSKTKSTSRSRELSKKQQSRARSLSSSSSSSSSTRSSRFVKRNNKRNNMGYSESASHFVFYVPSERSYRSARGNGSVVPVADHSFANEPKYLMTSSDYEQHDLYIARPVQTREVRMVKKHHRSSRSRSAYDQSRSKGSNSRLSSSIYYFRPDKSMYETSSSSSSDSDDTTYVMKILNPSSRSRNQSRRSRHTSTSSSISSSISSFSYDQRSSRRHSNGPSIYLVPSRH